MPLFGSHVETWAPPVTCKAPAGREFAPKCAAVPLAMRRGAPDPGAPLKRRGDDQERTHAGTGHGYRSMRRRPRGSRLSRSGSIGVGSASARAGGGDREAERIGVQRRTHPGRSEPPDPSRKTEPPLNPTADRPATSRVGVPPGGRPSGRVLGEESRPPPLSVTRCFGARESSLDHPPLPPRTTPCRRRDRAGPDAHIRGAGGRTRAQGDSDAADSAERNLDRKKCAH